MRGLAGFRGGWRPEHDPMAPRVVGSHLPPRGAWRGFLVLLEEKLGGRPGSWNTGVAARALRSRSRKGQQPSPSRSPSFCRLPVEGVPEGTAS